MKITIYGWSTSTALIALSLPNVNTGMKANVSAHAYEN